MTKLFVTNPQYRKFLLFQTFDGLGIGTFGVFMMWAIHDQFQNAFYTGMAGVMFAIPAISNFIIGPFVDARDKVTIIRLSCLGQLAAIVFLLVVSAFFEPGVWYVLIGILVFSTASLLAGPAGTALLPRIVKEDELVTANGLLTILGIISGIAVGTFLFASIDRVGFEVVYVVIATLLVLALISSTALKSMEAKPQRRMSLKCYFNELKEGLYFAKRGVLMLLLLAFVVQDLVATAAYVNVPMLADTFAATASGYVLIVFAASMGGMFGSYIAKIIEPKLELWMIFVGCFILAGLVRVAFAYVITVSFLGSLFILLIYAGLGVTIGIFCQSLLQKKPPQRMVARVNTIFISMLGITSVLGAFIGGILGTLLQQIETVFMLQGGVYIAIGLFLCLFKQVRALPKICDIEES